MRRKDRWIYIEEERAWIRKYTDKTEEETRREYLERVEFDRKELHLHKALRPVKIKRK